MRDTAAAFMRGFMGGEFRFLSLNGFTEWEEGLLRTSAGRF